ncbi:MAG TPA: DUF2125 domain-containing protein [Rhizomicrobium sp.]|jgi:hypothetical protein|nr:DUF2125 domain-containing protein [Rhizomicrobium sp.]
MRYSSRFFLYAPFVGLLLLAAVAMLHWWIAARALAGYLDTVNGHDIMPGVRMSFTKKRLAGFPFRLDTILKNLRLEVADVSGPVVWTSEHFAMHRLTYGRVQAILEAAGQQTLSWRDAHGTQHRFGFVPGTFRASAILDGGKLIRFDSEVADLDGQDFRAADVQFHFRVLRNRADLYLRLQNAHVPAGYARDLGSEISSLAVNASLDRTETLAKLLRGEQSPNTALETWRGNNGGIGVHDLALTKAGNALNFRGKLSFDDVHDLSGALGGGSNGQLRFDGNRISLTSVLARP